MNSSDDVSRRGLSRAANVNLEIFPIAFPKCVFGRAKRGQKTQKKTLFTCLQNLSQFPSPICR